MKQDEMQTERMPSPSCKILSKKDDPCLVASDTNSVVIHDDDYRKFLLDNSPDRQHIICQDADGCYFGDSLTLSEVSKVYGNGLPKAWLIPQLVNLSEFCGLKQDASSLQLKELALIIYNKYYWLKVDELLLFFYRFKSNCYKRFYCYFDPTTILESLKMFVDERYWAYTKREQEERERQAVINRKNAVPYEEYVKMKERSFFIELGSNNQERK